jgi:hypothetical protein
MTYLMSLLMHLSTFLCVGNVPEGSRLNKLTMHQLGAPNSLLCNLLLPMQMAF